MLITRCSWVFNKLDCIRFSAYKRFWVHLFQGWLHWNDGHGIFCSCMYPVYFCYNCSTAIYLGYIQFSWWVLYNLTELGIRKTWPFDCWVRCPWNLRQWVFFFACFYKRANLTHQLWQGMLFWAGLGTKLAIRLSPTAFLSFSLFQTPLSKQWYLQWKTVFCTTLYIICWIQP